MERQIRRDIVKHWNGILSKAAQVFLSRSFEMLNGLVVFMTRELLYPRFISPSIFQERGF